MSPSCRFRERTRPVIASCDLVRVVPRKRSQEGVGEQACSGPTSWRCVLVTGIRYRLGGVEVQSGDRLVARLRRRKEERYWTFGDHETTTIQQCCPTGLR